MVDETTTFTFPMVKTNKNSCYSSGGIANGRGNAAMALGAGVQVGSRFAASMESSAMIILKY
jgi:hypothetical protein